MPHPTSQHRSVTARPPRPEHLHESLDCLLEGIEVPDRYLARLAFLIRRERHWRPALKSWGKDKVPFIDDDDYHETWMAS